jgi:hypothetical protein
MVDLLVVRHADADALVGMVRDQVGADAELLSLGYMLLGDRQRREDQHGLACVTVDAFGPRQFDQGLAQTRAGEHRGTTAPERPPTDIALMRLHNLGHMDVRTDAGVRVDNLLARKEFFVGTHLRSPLCLGRHDGRDVGLSR